MSVGAGALRGRFLEGPGGSRLVVEENHDLPIARITATLLLGGADDPIGREGLAGFSAELSCRGAAGKTRAQIDEAVESLGADMAAGADMDSVTFDVETLSSNLEPALALLADAMLRPDFPALEVKRLRRELVAALDDLRDDDSRLARRLFARQLYGEAHPYGRPLSGTEASVARLDGERARRWMERAMSGGQILFGAAGDVDAAAIQDRIAHHFRVLRPGAVPRVRLKPPATPRGVRVLVVDKPERTQTQLLVGQPSVRRAHPDFLPLAVATTAFGGTFTSRLMNEVRVKRGLSYGASARLGQGRGERSVVMGMAPSLAQTVETLQLVLELWADFVEHGPTEEEVAFAREHLAASVVFQMATPEERVDLRVAVAVFDLPGDFLETLVPDIRAVTPDAVRAAMKRHLRPRDLAVTMVSTARDLMPLLERARLGAASIDVLPYDAY